jgi:hypothetical protein
VNVADAFVLSVSIVCSTTVILCVLMVMLDMHGKKKK